IFLDDDEAFDYWQEVGFPKERILRFGEEDNFWGPAGETGPCGPCSELHYDLGEGIGCGRPDCGPNCECGRFIEIWNLVFTQYDQQADGRRLPLPKPNIDTGMGLERTAAAMQGKISVYDTDLFAPIIDRVSRLAGKSYGEDEDTDRAIRIVAEHARAITFLIGDGVIPSNEGRGYVLRRVLRRAALFGRKLGLEEQFLGTLAEAVVSDMSHVYPELKRERKSILGTIAAEEDRFDQTLNVGLNLLDGIIEEARSSRESSISGEDVFQLYDTYGFPKELTAEIAAENGLSVDQEGFEKEMERQRERARVAQKIPHEEPAMLTEKGLMETEFVGPNKLKCQSQIWRLLVDGRPVKEASEGKEVSIRLNRTPFQAEIGGQVGDSGEIQGLRGTVKIRDTRTLHLPLHVGEVTIGTISDRDTVTAKVDAERRRDIARNHTATHLLQ
ncbi:MAG: alanine--tRNA ligase, partial [Dehalococcoidia bacterium]|nr:alanine--tRNA ligase [Dehalococcoidia bacterium]